MSSNPIPSKDPAATVLVTAPIIKIALAAGVLAFGVVALMMGHAPQNGPDMKLVWIMASMGIVTALGRLIVPRIIVAKLRAGIAAGTWSPKTGDMMSTPLTDESKLAAVYQIQMILGSALLEGGAFANLFAYMTQAHVISLVVAVLLWVGLLMDFPTKFGITSWIERQSRLLRDERPLMIGRK